MTTEKTNITSLMQKSWSYLKRGNDYWEEKTQPLLGRTMAEKLSELQTYFKLNSKQQTELQKVEAEDKGSDFIKRKVDDVNRNASHRTAFLANALIQLLLVNLSTLPILGYIPDSWFKVLLIGANLFVAFIAWRRIRNSKSQVLKGPGDEPDWTFWGMFRSNRRRHNKHIKDLAEPHKVRMRDERLFSIMYLVNAVTLIFASQLILTGYLPSLIRALVNFPLFILTIPLAIANAYWAFKANNQVVKAATERGKTLDKLKI